MISVGTIRASGREATNGWRLAVTSACEAMSLVLRAVAADLCASTQLAGSEDDISVEGDRPVALCYGTVTIVVNSGNTQQEGSRRAGRSILKPDLPSDSPTEGSLRSPSYKSAYKASGTHVYKQQMGVS